jgi:glyoxylase-like metal-dependent hydrolase (beta-lactamase superfamily II)
MAGLFCVGCAAEGLEDSARSLLLAAIDAMGTDVALEALGPVAVYSSGTLDKAAEGQAYSPLVSAPGGYAETTAVEPLGVAALWDYREHRYDGTHENFGESYPDASIRRLLLHDVGLAMPLRTRESDEDRARIRRRFPQLLLRELIRDSDSLDTLPAQDGLRRVQGSLRSGVPVTVSLDASTLFVRSVSFEQVVPGRGRAAIEWWYADYGEVAAGVWFPSRYGSRVGGLEYTTMSVDSVRSGDSSIFDPPEGLHLLEVREAPTQTDPRPLELRRLAEGVFVVPNVRSGFAPLVVEFDDFLVAVDAPASFPLLGQIPAGETDPAPSMSWHAERFVDRLQRQWPDKPISYLVLTHHHEDHVGGVRAFISAGATILGPPSAIEVARRLASLSPDMVDDRFSRSPQVLSGETVEQPRRISDGSRSLELVPVHGSPHADGMLIVSIQDAAMVYVSDLVTPAPLDAYPSANHRALDDFFANWLRSSGLNPDVVWSMHGDEPLTAEHLAQAGVQPGSGDI